MLIRPTTTIGLVLFLSAFQPAKRLEFRCSILRPRTLETNYNQDAMRRAGCGEAPAAQGVIIPTGMNLCA
jgi:hypothetical protein